MNAPRCTVLGCNTGHTGSIACGDIGKAARAATWRAYCRNCRFLSCDECRSNFVGLIDIAWQRL